MREFVRGNDLVNATRRENEGEIEKGLTSGVTSTDVPVASLAGTDENARIAFKLPVDIAHSLARFRDRTNNMSTRFWRQRSLDEDIRRQWFEAVASRAGNGGRHRERDDRTHHGYNDQSEYCREHSGRAAPETLLAHWSMFLPANLANHPDGQYTRKVTARNVESAWPLPGWVTGGRCLTVGERELGSTATV